MAFWRRPFRRKEEESSQRVAAAQLGVEAWLVPRSDVELSARLGGGAFGQVYACTVKDREENLVAKLINPKALRPEDADLFRTEVRIWSELDHPSCVKFMGICICPDEYILLCELCEGGPLSARHHAYLRKRRPPISTAAFVEQAFTIAEGMAYLHSRQIMHRDLKSQNVLITSRGQLQISDFGLAKFSPLEKAKLTAETGSYRWMAPEVLRHEPYDKMCDVYSYAVLCWEMLTYRMPFDDLQPVQAAFAMALEHKRPQIPEHCHKDVRTLLEEGWQANSEARPTFEQICEQLQKLRAKIRNSALLASPSSIKVDKRHPVSPSSASRKRNNNSGDNNSKRDLSAVDASTAGSKSNMKRPKSCNSLLAELNVGP